MAQLALIIAIEDYPDLEGGGLPPKLVGTLQAGQTFRDWLIAKWQSDGKADGQIIFCSEPPLEFGTGASRADIIKAILKLREIGAGTTDEFFFFFSGHGCMLVETPNQRSDVLIASNFQDANRSGDACLSLDEIVVWLRDHLGGNLHFYFVDACRNKLGPSDIAIGPLPPTVAQGSAQPTTLVLQSTVEGAVAAAGTLFPSALLDGLKGSSSAKVWDSAIDDKMFVKFESLRRYVKKRIAKQQPIYHQVEGERGESEAILATVAPVPRCKCEIEIETALPTDEYKVVVRRGRSDTDDEPLVFLGASFKFELEPDIYQISVRFGETRLKPSAAGPWEVYDDVKLTYNKGALISGSTPASATGPARARITIPATAGLEVRNVISGKIKEFAASQSASLDEGHYVAKWIDLERRVFDQREFQVVKNKPIELDQKARTSSVPHASIARLLPKPKSGVFRFSKSLQNVTDTDLNVWLALVGGGRIVKQAGTDEILFKLPLHDFSQQSPGSSPIYVLAGLDVPEAALKAALHHQGAVDWADVPSTRGMPGIYERVFQSPPGSQLLSLQIANQPTYTLATVAIPNRATLITLTRDERRAYRVVQYLLPMAHLAHLLPEPVRARAMQEPLVDLLFLAQAHRAFAKRRNLTTDVPGPQLAAMLDGKWLDPIACSMAIYEHNRRGRIADARQAMKNMTDYFPEVPDLAAFARLGGEEVDRPQGVPLYFDGLRAFPDCMTADWLPFKGQKLDFTSCWTAWHNVVS